MDIYYNIDASAFYLRRAMDKAKERHVSAMKVVGQKL